MSDNSRKTKFKCFKCGCCCASIEGVDELAGFSDRHGHCRYFDADTRLCQIYDQRPKICNIAEYYEDLADEVSWDDYVFTNMLNCVLLRWSQGVEEPEDSPFAGMQEQIARKVAQDRQALADE